ncbi:MAG: hypothetical protein NWF06_01330 [Candidatus Bathyarchaeota archaeon]|nr:hypothetical protein [Candidatus Bathyarchaeum sp.]
MIKKRLNQRATKFHASKKALAIPMTFLMLFASLFAVTSVTYYFAVSKVNSNSQVLNISSAKQNMNLLEQTIQYVLWQPGSSKTCEFNDCAGTLKTEPSENLLSINITDGTFSECIFNSSIGEVIYELPYSSSAETGLYLQGTSQVVENKSGAVMTQLYIEQGEEHPEIVLRYRPIVSAIAGGTQDGKPINNVRIYVVNLNSSQNIELMGNLPLKICCINTAASVNSYNLSYSPESLTVHVALSSQDAQVCVPISSNVNGTIINVELVVCNTAIERGLR